MPGQQGIAQRGHRFGVQAGTIAQGQPVKAFDHRGVVAPPGHRPRAVTKGRVFNGVAIEHRAEQPQQAAQFLDVGAGVVQRLGALGVVVQRGECVVQPPGCKGAGLVGDLSLFRVEAKGHGGLRCGEALGKEYPPLARRGMGRRTVG